MNTQPEEPFDTPPIPEKKFGGITFAGYLGILLGVLFIYVGTLWRAQARDDDRRARG